MNVQELEINLPPDELGEPMLLDTIRLADAIEHSLPPSNTPEPEDE
jgi:hypothetical protein